MANENVPGHAGATTTPGAQSRPADLNTAEGFAWLVLRDIGAEATSNNMNKMLRWMAAEEPQGEWWSAGGNPLNLSASEGQPTTGTNRGTGYPIFANVAAAAKAVANNLSTGNYGYGAIVQNLRSDGSLDDFAGVVGASSWAGGKYKGNSNTPGYTISHGASDAGGTPAGKGPAGQTAEQLQNQQLSAAEANAYKSHSYAPYTGPDAYKGFDMSAIPADMQVQARQSIDDYLSKPGLQDRIDAAMEQNYGSDLYMAGDPQIRTLLIVGSAEAWWKDPNLFQNLVKQTTWWKTYDAGQRSFQQLQYSDPATLKKVVDAATSRVINIANTMGVQLTQRQLHSIAWNAASFSATQSGQYAPDATTDQNIYRQIGSMFRANQLNGIEPGAQTATRPGGDVASLRNQFTSIARNYYLNLTPAQIDQQVQKYLSTDTGESNFLSGALEGFTSYAQNMAKAMYPALGALMGTTSTAGTDNTPYQALAGYRTLIANYTGYQGDPDTINLMSPQWSWILSGKEPPNVKNATATAGSGAPSTTPSGSSAGSGNPSLPTYDQVQTYLMGQPQFQKTDLAKSMAWDVGSAITKAFGYG